MCHACSQLGSMQQLQPQQLQPHHNLLHSSHYSKIDSHTAALHQQQQQQPQMLPALDALHALHPGMSMHDGESDDALSLPSLPSHPISSRGVSQTSVTVASPVTATAVAAQPVQAVRVAAPAAAAAGSKPGRKGAAAKKAVVPPPPSQRPTRIRTATKRSESDSDDGGSDDEDYTYTHTQHSRPAPQMATIASHHVHQAVMATTAGGSSGGGTLASPVIARAVSAGAGSGSPLLVARAVSAATHSSSPSTLRRGLGASSSSQPPPGVVMAVQIPLPPGTVAPQQAKVLTAPPPGGLGSPSLTSAQSRRASLKQQPSPLGALVLPPRKNSMTDIGGGGGGLQSKTESPASASRSVRGGARGTPVVGNRGSGGAVPASPRTPRGRALTAVATASPIITASPVPQHAQLLRDSLHLARVIHSSSPTVSALSSSGSTSPTVPSACSPKKRSLNAAYSSSMGSASVGSTGSGSSSLSFDSGGSPKPRMYHASPRQQPFEFTSAMAANAAAAGSFVMPAPVPPLHASSLSQQQHSVAQQALLHARFSALAGSSGGSSSAGSSTITNLSSLSGNDDPLALTGGKALEVGTPPQLSLGLGHFTPPSPISPLPVHFQNLMDRQDGLHAAADAAQQHDHHPHAQLPGGGGGGVHGDAADADPDSEHPPYPGHHKLARAGSPSGEFGVYRAVSNHTGADDDDGSFSTAQYLHSDLHGDDESNSASATMTPLQNTRNISTGSSSAATTALPETPRTQALSHLMSHTGFAAGVPSGLSSNSLLSWEGGKDVASTGSVSAGSNNSWARRAAGSQLVPPSLLDYGSSPNPPLVGASSSSGSMMSGSLGASASSLSAASSLHASPAGVPAFSSAAASSSVFAVSPSHGSMVAPPLPRRALQLLRHDDDDPHDAAGPAGAGAGEGQHHSPLFLPLHGHQRTTDPFGMDMELHL